VFAAVEPVLRGVFEEFADGKPVPQKFPRIPYAEAMRSYGSDKPDLRNPIRMQDVTAHFRGSGFKVFAGMIASDPAVEVWAIPAPKGGNRAFCDRMNSWRRGEGQPDLVTSSGATARRAARGRSQRISASSAVKDPQSAWPQRRRCRVLPRRPAEGLSQIRRPGARQDRRGARLGRPRSIRVLLIVDFPMYEWNEEEKKIDFSHNPFSMPNLAPEEFLSLDPGDKDKILGLKAIQYDIVCNGVELSSGAIRNHRPDVMKKAFAIAGYDESVLEQKFGGMLRALSLGAPPHGGIAPGIDRIVMLLCGEENLREVVLFPMNQRAEDLLMGAPSEATPKQLRELHIKAEFAEVGDGR